MDELRQPHTESESSYMAEDQETGSTLVAIGAVLADRYRVLSVLGRGGMGVVYAVEHVFLKKTYALKTLDVQAMSDVAWRRFQNEAEAVSRLDHQNAISVHDFGVLADNQPYYVMDLIDGQSLSQRLKSGPLPMSDALKIFIQVSFALSHAHERGVIHRDMKPSNIMLAKGDAEGSPIVKIVDFGISKLVRETIDTQELTKTGEIFGSPLYMSPEQCLGTSIDHRTDIYSVGCALFETLTGTPPFVSDTPLTTMMKHNTERTPTLREASLGQNFPQPLEEVVAQMLEKDPRKRYQRFDDVARDLIAMEQGMPLEQKRSATAGDNTTQKKSEKSHSWLVVALASAVLILVAVIIVLIAGKGSITPTVTGTATTSKIDTAPGGLPDIPVETEHMVGKKPFSTIEKDSRARSIRVFHFPKLGFPIGRVGADLDSTAFQAVGDVSMPSIKPVVFQPSDEFCERTNLFERIRPDEVAVLIISGCKSAGKNLSPYLKDWTKLVSLQAESTPVDDDVLQSLSNSPALTGVMVNDTEVTADGVCKMKNLKNLSDLEVGWITDGSTVIRGLQGSKTIRTLVIWQSGLHDSDILLLNKLKSITYLDICRNPKLSDKGISYLTALPALSHLQIDGCSVTPKCIPYLRKMRNLKDLYVSDNWSPEDQKTLKEALPDVKIVFRPY